MSEDLDGLRATYAATLATLTFNSRPIINTLTMLAEDHRHGAHVIADLILAQIERAPADRKLPLLYLVDSIIKNVRHPYVAHFSARLVPLYEQTYVQADPAVQRSMEKLLGTWNGYLDDGLVRTLDAFVRSRRAPPVPEPRPPLPPPTAAVVQRPLPPPPTQDPHWRAPQFDYRDYGAGAPPPPQQQQQQQQRPLQPQGYPPLPPPPAREFVPSMAPPPPSPAPSLPPPAHMRDPYPPQQPMYAPGPYPPPTRGGYYDAGPAPAPAPAPYPSTIRFDRDRGGYPAFAPGPGPGPAQNGAGYYNYAGPPPPPPPRDFGAAPYPPAPGAAAAAASYDRRPPPATSWNPPPPSIPALEPIASITLTNDALKRRYAGAVEAMWENLTKVCTTCGMRFQQSPDGQTAFGAHMDWHFRRNRREKEKLRKAVPREWYLPANVMPRCDTFDRQRRASQVWTSVAEAVAFVNARAAERTAEADAGVPGAAPVAAPVVSCPVGDDRTGTCVVCGDKFEKFFDSDREEWMYRDAVRVNGRLYHPACQDDAERPPGKRAAAMTVDEPDGTDGKRARVA